MEKDRLFIGELSKRTNVPVRTIRYYEDFCILDKPKRTGSDYRIYSQKDVDKLVFIKKAKEFGLKLSEIKEIICCAEKGLQPCCSLVRNLFTKKIKEYKDKIVEINTAKKRLEEKLNKWVKPKQAKKMKYSVCPQIERTEIKKEGKENDKKKR
ncbi:MAG: MerR family transcriptional regulator [Candidatus Scalindua sp.]